MGYPKRESLWGGGGMERVRGGGATPNGGILKGGILKGGILKGSILMGANQSIDISIPPPILGSPLGSQCPPQYWGLH